MTQTDDLFTLDDSNLFSSPYEILQIALEKKIFKEVFLFYHEMVCCVYS